MKINLSSLEEGLNILDYNHTVKSLDLADQEDISANFINPIEVHLEINKIGNQLFFKFNLKTIGTFTCDRCLEEFSTRLEDEFRIVYTNEYDYDVNPGDEQNYRYLSSDSIEIDFSPDIRESVLLLPPMKNVCSEDCKGICVECGNNLNRSVCNHGLKAIDPRWEKLKQIYDQNS